MNKIMEFWKGIASAVVNIGMLIYVAVQDENISFDEANGIWLAIMALFGTGAVVAVRNKPKST